MKRIFEDINKPATEAGLPEVGTAEFNALCAQFFGGQKQSTSVKQTGNTEFEKEIASAENQLWNEPTGTPPPATPSSEKSSAEETRVYATNIHEMAVDEIRAMSNNEFIELAEEQGLIWTLKGFQESFNRDEISDQWIIRIIEPEEPPTPVSNEAGEMPQQVTIEYTNGDFCVYGENGHLIEDNNGDYATAERWANEEGYEVVPLTRTEQYEMYIQYSDECIEENKMPVQFVQWREQNKLPNL